MNSIPGIPGFQNLIIPINISEKDQQEGVLTSGSNLSYWIDSVEPIRFSPLNQDLKTEIVIIGGGIAGLSVAYCLVRFTCEGAVVNGPAIDDLKKIDLK